MSDVWNFWGDIPAYPASVFEDAIHPRLGFEFDWLAADVTNRVAIFSSAGYGAVPLAAATHVAEIDAAIDTLRALRGRRRFIRETLESGDYTWWFEFASRGLYAYDWKHWDGPYERVASPTHPLDAGALPTVARTVACLVRFPGSFASTRTIDAPKAAHEPST